MLLEGAKLDNRHRLVHVIVPNSRAANPALNINPMRNGWYHTDRYAHWENCASPCFESINLSNKSYAQDRVN